MHISAISIIYLVNIERSYGLQLRLHNILFPWRSYRLTSGHLFRHLRTTIQQLQLVLSCEFFEILPFQVIIKWWLALLSLFLSQWVLAVFHIYQRFSLSYSVLFACVRMVV
uniref:TOR n=1 Tax=Arundo donax TaxID=35708 RepID=A0A0A9CXF7_ARUDO